MSDLRGRLIKTVAVTTFGAALFFAAALAVLSYMESDNTDLSAVAVGLLTIFCFACVTAVLVGRRVLAILPQETEHSLESIGEQIDQLESQNEELRTELVEQLEKLGTAAIDLLEANEFKDRFLGMAAHDLRNPINVVRMMSEMLMAMDLEEDTKKEFYKDINHNALQMLALINDLLDVSAIESGTLQLQLVSNNLKTEISNRIRMQQMTAQPKNITIEMFDDDVPDSMFDADRIGQVADNLLSNAVKYSPAGSEIRVSLLSDDHIVGFSVEDDGPGIPEDELDRLFQEFAKVSTQPTAGETSTGLGLSIAKKIIDTHSGHIDVDTEVGRGTTFTVTLPRTISSQDGA